MSGKRLQWIKTLRLRHIVFSNNFLEWLQLTAFTKTGNMH